MRIPFFSRNNQERKSERKLVYEVGDIKEYLPIGSVVLLKEGDKRLMIFGIIQEEYDEYEEYDYIGVPYPEGNMGDEHQYLFMHEDIDKVYFRGYEDVEREEFLERLNKYHQKEME